MSQAAFVADLIDALVAGGVTHAVLSPGYRSAPLAVALAAHPGLVTEVIVDERAAAFFALGLARASERPVVLACTSGSAVANYLPAIVEAHGARVPLLVLTADRPPELQHVGAPQTIAQRGIFGGFVVHEDELAAPAAIDDDVARDPWRPRIALALSRAADEAEGGPVHLNLPLRKPLIGDAGEGSGGQINDVHTGIRGGSGRPLPRILRGVRRPDAAALAAITAALAPAERPVIVAGPSLRGLGVAEGRAIADLAARADWPLVADVLSPARPFALQEGQAALHGAPELAADAVLWFGPAPTSAALLRWIGRVSGPVIQVIADARWRDPGLRADLVLWADLAAAADALGPPPAPAAWAARWRARAAAALGHLAAAGAHGRWEGALIHMAFETWPGDHVHVASSSAIRDADLLARLRPGARALGNRGANGIDGTVATAAGEAAALGAPVLAIVGDLALAHDLGALIHCPAPRLTVLVLDNGGGQIFRQLPPLRGRPDFERLFATPVAMDVAALAGGAGWRYRLADDDAGLRAALAEGYERGRTIIHARVDAEAAAAARAALWAGLARAGAEAGG